MVLRGRLAASRHVLGREPLIAVLFLAPSFLVLGLFGYGPLLANGYLSLTDWHLLAPTRRNSPPYIHFNTPASRTFAACRIPSTKTRSHSRTAR